jgi:heme/copper-type cytochrome/quinol oxidase subunit 4
MIGCAAAIALAAWRINMLVLIPLIVTSVPLLFLRHRYDSRVRWRQLNRWFTGLYILAVVVVSLLYLHHSKFIITVIACALIIGTLNNRFYIFLAEKRGRFFALAAIPFHLLYHFYNGVSFVMGSLRWAIHELKVRAAEPVKSSAPID